MWLYMMAFMITSVVEQAFFVYKACRVDHGYSEEVCANLNENQTLKAAVQVTRQAFKTMYTSEHERHTRQAEAA